MKPKSELYVVKFYADWCGPCKTLSTSFEDGLVKAELSKYGNNMLESRLQDKNLLNTPIEVNIDVDRESATEFSVTSIPLIIIIDRDRKVYKRLSGYLPASQLAEWLKNPFFNKDGSPIHSYTETSLLK